MDLTGGLSKEYLRNYDQMRKENPFFDPNPWNIHQQARVGDYIYSYNSAGDTLGKERVGGDNQVAAQPYPDSSGGYTGPSGPDLDKVRREVELGVKNIRQGGQSAFRDVGNQFETGARGLANTVRQGQQGIDIGRQNTAINRMRSIGDLVGTIRQGIQSGAVKLANMNALDSSGAEGIAKAYSTFGNRERGSIMNQAALQNRDFDIQQKNLNIEEQEKVRQLRVASDTETDRITRDVTNKLQALDLEAQNGGLTTRLEVDQLKRATVQGGIERLARLDKWLTGRLAEIKPMTSDQIEAAATRLNALGQIPANDLQYETAPGIEDGGGGLDGAPISQLPLFLRPPEEEEVVV